MKMGDLGDRVFEMEERLDALSDQVRRDPELKELPEWQSIVERFRACDRDLSHLTVEEFDELERWARRVKGWRVMQEME